MRRSLWPLALIALSGCFARGFHRQEVTQRLQGEAIQATDEEIAKALAVRPQLPFPCRVAIYLPPSTWTAADREIIEGWSTKLKKDRIVSDMFVMSSIVATGTSIKEVRVAAARHGADAVLILNSVSNIESYKNIGAVLNLTIVGGYLIPSNHRNVQVTIQGVLVDVGNGYLYASMEADGAARTVQPAFLVEEKPTIDKAQRAALTNFGPELNRRMHALQASIQTSVQNLPVRMPPAR